MSNRWALLALTLTLTALAVLTVLWPTWIEATVGVDPDGGNGAAEWLIVATLAFSAIAVGRATRREWARAYGSKSMER